VNRSCRTTNSGGSWQARAVWSKERRAGPLVVLGRKELPPAKIADLFLNGDYFHLEEAKRAELHGVPPMMTQLMRHLFLDFVNEATRQVGYMKVVIQEAGKRGALASSR
jgi:hypothetical protein